MKLAVIYIARYCDGAQKLQAFADGYRRHRAGENHNLYIALKGCRNDDEIDAAKRIFASITCQFVVVPEDGFCKGTISLVARNLDEDFICPISTTGEIRCDDWLAKLFGGIAGQDDIGIVGSSASFQSLRTSVEFRHYLFRRGFYDKSFRARGEKYFSFLTTKHAAWKSYIRHPLHHQKKLRAIAANDTMIKASFPRFPNPHIRTSAYIMRRDDFLRYCDSYPQTKWDVMMLESGHRSLTRRSLDQGQRACVIGVDGKSYGLEEMAASNTFMSGDQTNILVSDQRIGMYDAYPADLKLGYARICWGDYAPVRFPADMPTGETFFAAGHPLDVTRSE